MDGWVQLKPGIWNCRASPKSKYQAQIFVNCHVGQSCNEDQDQNENVDLQQMRFSQIFVPKNNESKKKIIQR